MQEFDLSDLRQDLSSEAREIMLDLILAWAHLDGALSMWVAVKFQVPFDRLSLLLPKQDGASKLLKLKRLYKLEGNTAMAAKAQSFKDDYEREVYSRNIVAHSNCMGSLISDPRRIVFQTFVAPAAGKMAVDVIHLANMRTSLDWAHALASTIDGLLAKGAEVERLHRE